MEEDSLSFSIHLCFYLLCSHQIHCAVLLHRWGFHVGVTLRDTAVMTCTIVSSIVATQSTLLVARDQVVFRVSSATNGQRFPSFPKTHSTHSLQWEMAVAYCSIVGVLFGRFGARGSTELCEYAVFAKAFPKSLANRTHSRHEVQINQHLRIVHASLCGSCQSPIEKFANTTHKYFLMSPRFQPLYMLPYPSMRRQIASIVSSKKPMQCYSTQTHHTNTYANATRSCSHISNRIACW